MVEFNKLTKRIFADGFDETFYVADVNYAITAIVLQSKNSPGIVLDKDKVIDLANTFQFEEIDTMSDDGDLWDDIFGEIAQKGFIDIYNIENPNCLIGPNQVVTLKKLVDAVNEKYGILFPNMD